MRLATLNTSDGAGGAEKIARQLAEGYREAGHDVCEVVGYSAEYAEGDGRCRLVLDEEAKNRGGSASDLAFSPRQRLLMQAAGREELAYLASRGLLARLDGRIDLLHAHNLHGYYFDPNQLALPGRTFPIVLTLHDAWLLAGHCAHSFECERWRHGCGSCPGLDIYPGLVADGTRDNLAWRVDLFKRMRPYVATPSNWLMNKVKASPIAPYLRGLRVIHNGFDVSVFHPGNKLEARRRLNLPESMPILLFMANGIRTNIWKDFASMRAVLANLGNSPGTPLMLLALGEEGPDEQIGRARIVFRGYESDEGRIADYYRAADMYLHMSKVDTFPNVVAEALCSGLPVAATATGGIPEQVRSLFRFPGLPFHESNRANGVLVPTGDVAAMSAFVSCLLDQSESLAWLSANAALDRSFYDRHRMTDAYLSWFAEIMESQSGEEGMTTKPTDRKAAWLDLLGSNLAKARPVNRVFGLDRGMPIDRWYIERFLALHAPDIAGCVLEISEKTYTERFGASRVSSLKILSASVASPADYVGDIADPSVLPADAFDCMIVVQTLQCIFDIKGALQGIHRALKPGGVLLATIPGITQISRYDMDRWGDFWRMTTKAVGRLFVELFPSDNIDVTSFGNAMAATAFLNGLSVDDLTPEVLDQWDRDYEMVIAVRLVKSDEARQKPGAVRLRSPLQPPVILMYHRVAALSSDPQCLCVTPDHFEEHMAVLREMGVPTSLSSLTQGMEEGLLCERAIAVTFDDGYEDNLVNAKPILSRHDVPATVFVTSGMIGSSTEFWWDELERILLQPGSLPQKFSINLNEQDVSFDLGPYAELTAAECLGMASWTVLDADDPTPRHRLYRFLHGLLFQVGSGEHRAAILSFLLSWSRCSPHGRSTHRALSADGLSDLASGGLVEVGAHTVSHPVLSRLDPAAQKSEILESQTRIEALTGVPVRAFAYPYGDPQSFSQDTLNILKAAGFGCAVTTVPGPVSSCAQLFELPRLCVRNWTGEDLRSRITACWSGLAVQ